MAKELKGLDKQKLADYWRYNIRLTTITMVIWFVVTYVAIFFAPQLVLLHASANFVNTVAPSGGA